ncbi:hypothetical protein Q31b_31690 [Novipirellula aureliae]|uniref:Uncharacterized protein n=1 Tax=Novipirellula aureliae TaxID=2527966 RepID=A0A5C6DUD4_9BACT|nr:hypothetical protein [Novipirellula aureliae]TWU39854.1 hypothetical protein Q31b_31690 [Novipirellula aureliae]
MFANITHILTLIAFAAHAVLGCCAHHSHAGGIDCCSSKTTQVARDDDHSPEPHAHVCCGHVHLITNAHDVDGVDVLADIHSDVEAVCASESPCHHDDHCNGSRCSFVAEGSRVLNVDAPILVGEFSFYGANCVANDYALLLSRVIQQRVESPLGMSCLTSSQHCVHLQSWQI